jgi:hypothetical protein
MRAVIRSVFFHVTQIKFWAVWFSIGGLVTLSAVPGVSHHLLVEKANPYQQASMAESIEAIKAEEVALNQAFLDIKENNLINSKNVTFFPLRAMFLHDPGSRDRDVMNESAIIFWEGQAVKNVSFRQRNSILGTAIVHNQRMQYNPAAVHGESPVEIIASETLEYSNAKYISYRFPPSEEPIRDKTETIILDGYEKIVKVIYIRDVKTRVMILRDMRDQMQELNFRINTYIDNIKQRELREAKKVINRK